MTEVQDWLRAKAAKEARLPQFHDVLGGGGIATYVLFRGRFLFLNLLIGLILRGIHFGFLHSMFAAQTLYSALVGVVISQLVIAFWWGALELLRSEVRRLYSEGLARHIPAAVGQWLGNTLVFGGILMLSSVVAVLVCFASGILTPLLFFALALIFRIGISLPVRTLHSGIFAITRIYRPFAIMAACEVVGVLTLAALYQALGPFSLGVASFLTSLLYAAVTVKYALRAYRVKSLYPISISFRPLEFGLILKSIPAGISFTLIRLDDIIASLLLFIYSGDALIAAFAYLCSPIIRAGAEWAELFYFDLKRKEISLFANLHSTFERKLLLASIPVGILLWGMALGFATLFLGYAEGARVALPLLPLFLFRSTVGVLLLQIFSREYYSLIIIFGISMLAGVGLIGAQVPSLTILCGLALLALLLLRRGFPQVFVESPVLIPATWLARVVQIQEPICVCVAKFSEETADSFIPIFARRIREQLGYRTPITSILPMSVAWVVFRDSQPTDLEFLALGDGLIENLRCGNSISNGKAALASAIEDRLLPWSFLLTKRDGDLMPLEKIIESFSNTFPNGFITNLSKLKLFASRIGPQAINSVRQALSYLGPQRLGRPSSEVNLLVDGKDLIAIFSIPLPSDRLARRDWRELINKQSLLRAWSTHASS